jgi:hypothetical protein
MSTRVVKKVDLNTLLDQVDVNAFLARVNLGPLLDRVDVNGLVSRIDMDTLVERTDLGAAIARSSGGMTTEALDAVRGQAVGLDQFVDRQVQRLLRRRHPARSAPAAALLRAPAAVIPRRPSHEPPMPSTWR